MKIKVRNYKAVHRRFNIISLERVRLKHEVVKLICMMIINKKYKPKVIYTEHPIPKTNRITDIYFEDKKDRYAVEVQANVTSNWQKKVELDYYDAGLTPMIVDLNKLPDNLNLIWNELEVLL